MYVAAKPTLTEIWCTDSAHTVDCNATGLATHAFGACFSTTVHIRFVSVLNAIDTGWCWQILDVWSVAILNDELTFADVISTHSTRAIRAHITGLGVDTSRACCTPTINIGFVSVSNPVTTAWCWINSGLASPLFWMSTLPWQIWDSHAPLTQSEGTLQARASSHFGHVSPPQSTSVSSLFRTPSLQLGACKIHQE